LFEYSIDTNKCMVYNLVKLRGGYIMKEMLHSKVLMGFVVFVLSFTYLSTFSVEPTNVVLEDNTNIENELVLK